MKPRLGALIPTLSPPIPSAGLAGGAVLAILAILAVRAAPAAADPRGSASSEGSAATAQGHGDGHSDVHTDARDARDARTAHPAAPLFEHARLSIEPSGRAFHQLSIDNPLGDVRVEGHDGPAIEIETHKSAPDEEALDRLHISLVPNPDGTVTIRTTADGGREHPPVARSAVRIDLVIRAPRDARVEASVSSGKLEVVNMDAGSELDTASGPISVRNVQGEVLTHSVSGATRLAQVFGSVDAQTLWSDLDLDTIGGERLIASVNHGRIDGRRVRARDIELTATDGRIFLEAEAALRGHLVISSFKGDVDVQLRSHGALFVRARGAKVDLGTAARTQPNGWVEAAIGAGDNAAHVGAALVELRALQGDVRFSIIESRP